MRPYNFKLKCWWDGAFKHNGKMWQCIGQTPEGLYRVIDVSNCVEMRRGK